MSTGVLHIHSAGQTNIPEVPEPNTRAVPLSLCFKSDTIGAISLFLSFLSRLRAGWPA